MNLSTIQDYTELGWVGSSHMSVVAELNIRVS
jgi:hypothetical protein